MHRVAVAMLAQLDAPIAHCVLAETLTSINVTVEESLPGPAALGEAITACALLVAVAPAIALEPSAALPSATALGSRLAVVIVTAITTFTAASTPVLGLWALEIMQAARMVLRACPPLMVPVLAAAAMVLLHAAAGVPMLPPNPAAILNSVDPYVY